MGNKGRRAGRVREKSLLTDRTSFLCLLVLGENFKPLTHGITGNIIYVHNICVHRIGLNLFLVV